ncbi:conserved hypothetical protein [Xanthomonas citri pv. citri]|nr:conserved hypothetical protein [Xanthomonas citri pv. citri]
MDDRRPGRALTGAWIETLKRSSDRGFKVGRALTGAWIETNAFDAHKALAQEVAPSRARGLKPVQAPPPDPLAEVAPSRARGLKPRVSGCASDLRRSRPHGRVD